ncbi:MAG TPA: choice-of-anchor J domain-containing protein, partial [Chitinophagaceae bacterium]
APNGGADDFSYNDTLYSFINIVTTSATLPLAEDFSSSTFPPIGWQTWNPNGGGTPNTWQRDANSGATNAGSAFFDDYNLFEVGTLDELITPAIDPGTTTDVQLNFKVAYAVVDSVDVSTWDGLEVYVSGDGGKNYNLVYKKTGNQLATAPVDRDTFTAAPSQASRWRSESIALSPYVVTGQKLIIKFRNLDSYGNDIYIDDIDISAICASCTRDLEVESISHPRGAECSGDVTSSATIKNKGVETITAFSIGYEIDNGTARDTTITGVNLHKNDTLSVLLPGITGVATGQHVITVYSFNPVSVIGTGDLFTSNDTLQKTFGIAGTVSAPLSEGFESATFPPAGWVDVNTDASISWARTAPGNSSTSSAYVNNFNYAFTNRVDELYTPEITYPLVDSVTLSFDVASASLADGSPTDTLEVLVTKNCGNTFTSVYKKWGTALQTVPTVSGGAFTPSTPSQWRTETIDLTTIFPSGPIQVIFRNTNNNKNNIFIDNVDLKTRILPARLKREDLLVLPNPFKDQFTVWHYLPPTDLRFIAVYNSTGQIVWFKQYDGNANKQEVVDLSRNSAGVYVVRLIYADANHDATVKIVKY